MLCGILGCDAPKLKSRHYVAWAVLIGSVVVLLTNGSKLPQPDKAYLEVGFSGPCAPPLWTRHWRSPFPDDPRSRWKWDLDQVTSTAIERGCYSRNR